MYRRKATIDRNRTGRKENKKTAESCERMKIGKSRKSTKKSTVFCYGTIAAQLTAVFIL